MPKPRLDTPCHLLESPLGSYQYIVINGHSKTMLESPLGSYQYIVIKGHSKTMLESPLGSLT